MQTQKMTARHWGILATTVFCTFGCAAVAFSTPGLCYRPVAQMLGVEVFNVSFYMTIVYLCEVIGSPIVGKLLEKYDNRIICTIAALFTSCGYMAMSQYTELWQWYVSGAFIGFGEITLLWLMVAGLLNRWFKKKLGLVIGVSYAMTGLGGAVLNIIGQFLLGGDLSGWRDVYLYLGLIALCLSVPFTLFAIRTSPEECGLRAYGADLNEVEKISADGHVELPGISFKDAIKKPYFYALIFAGCMANIGGIFPQHFTTFYQGFVATVDHMGLENVTGLMIMSGTLEACTMIGMAAGKVLIGALESKSIQLALIVGCVGGFCGLVAIWQGGSNTFEPGSIFQYILFGGGLFYGLVYPMVTTLLPYMTRLLFGNKDYDQIYSIILIPVNLIGAFAASGLALIYQNAGWDMFFIVGLISIVIIYFSFVFAYNMGKKVYLEQM